MANHDYLLKSNDVKSQLRAEILILMLRGAGYAAIFALGVVLFVAVFYWVGLLLPEESRETEDPTPFSQHMIIESDKTLLT